MNALTFLVKRLQYSYWFSRISRLFLIPLLQVQLRGLSRLAKALKINGYSGYYAGVQITFPPNIGVRFASSIFWNGAKGGEPLVAQIFSNTFAKVRTFVDVGSNFGIYSVLAQKLNNEIKVYGFEPMPELFRINGVFHKVNRCCNQEIFMTAVSNRSGVSKLHIPKIPEGVTELSTSSLEASFSYNQKFAQEEREIQVVTLDDFLLPLLSAVDSPLLVKIDVEGHETAVLQGACRMLNLFRPLIIVEIWQAQRSMNDLVVLIDEMKYQVYTITDAGLFRLLTPDLLRFNGERDFLLVPSELSEGRLYFPFQELGQLVVPVTQTVM